MDLGRLSMGEKISGISAILLYVSMCVDWFSVKVVNASSLLFLLEGPVSGESALERSTTSRSFPSSENTARASTPTSR